MTNGGSKLQLLGSVQALYSNVDQGQTVSLPLTKSQSPNELP